MDRTIGKMGCLPSPYDPHLMRVEDFMQPKVDLPPLPASVSYNQKIKPSDRRMYGNDKYGCCVVAAAANVIQTWTANAGKMVTIPDQDVIDLYLKLTGGVDRGLNPLDFIKYWKKNPLWGHPLGAYLAFDPQNKTSWDYVTMLGGVVFAAFALPTRCEAQFKGGKPWSVVNSDLSGDDEPGSLGGHMMTSAEYHPWGDMLDTWQVTQPATNDWVYAYADEAYWLVGLDWFDKNHVTPIQGLHWSALLAALQAAANIPVPDPPSGDEQGR